MKQLQKSGKGHIILLQIVYFFFTKLLTLVTLWFDLYLFVQPASYNLKPNSVKSSVVVLNRLLCLCFLFSKNWSVVTSFTLQEKAKTGPGVLQMTG